MLRSQKSFRIRIPGGPIDYFQLSNSNFFIFLFFQKPEEVFLFSNFFQKPLQVFLISDLKKPKNICSLHCVLY